MLWYEYSHPILWGNVWRSVWSIGKGKEIHTEKWVQYCFWLKTSCYSRKCLLFLFWKVQSEFFHWRRGMWFLVRPFIESWLVLEQIGPKYYCCKCECLTLMYHILILCLWMFLTYCVACCGTVSSKMWSKEGQWERPTSNDRHSTAETECTFNVNLQVVWHFSGVR